MEPSYGCDIVGPVNIEGSFRVSVTLDRSESAVRAIAHLRDYVCDTLKRVVVCWKYVK